MQSAGVSGHLDQSGDAISDIESGGPYLLCALAKRFLEQKLGLYPDKEASNLRTDRDSTPTNNLDNFA